MSYEQAKADHSYLWAIGEAEDMTGGYVDSEDLERLLAKPTKATARQCFESQIRYWFQVGPDPHQNTSGIDWSDPKVREIAERYGVTTP